MTKITLNLAYKLFIKKDTKALTDFSFYFIITLLSIPFIINELYKIGGYVTMWSAGDVLSFYGGFLSFIGTVVLGALALYQNKKANDINEKLQKKQLLIEKTSIKPQFIINDLSTELDKVYIKNNNDNFSICIFNFKEKNLNDKLWLYELIINLKNTGNGDAFDIRYNVNSDKIKEYKYGYCNLIKIGDYYNLIFGLDFIISREEFKATELIYKTITIHYNNSNGICFKQEIEFKISLITKEQIVFEVNKSSSQEIVQEEQQNGK